MTAEEYIKNELKRYLENNKIEDVRLTLSQPKQKQFGDYSSNLAMQLASQLSKKPRDIALEIVDFIHQDANYITKVELAGPGFINFYISDSSLYEQLQQILTQEDDFAKEDLGKGVKTQIEFISANPTGPLTIGHGRQAVLGDTIARLLEYFGYDVTREYYYNDAGRQMRILGNSVRLRYLQLLGEKVELPEDHYQGEYITDIARTLVKEKSDSLKNITDSDIFKEKAEHEVFKNIRTTIRRLKFDMDVYFNEKSLYDDKKIDEVVSLLRDKNLVEEKDGAVWFLTSKLGMDQDRVIIKSTGEPTYRLPDIAYHREKYERGFEQIIDIFGADHIDTYPDVLLGLKSLGYDPDRVTVLIHQFVTLTEGTEKIKMSTRKANFVTLDELMDEVGVDVTRFFFLMRHMNSHLNFDLTLAKAQSDENPVYYVQYAHARIFNIIKFGQEKGIYLSDKPNLDLLEKKEELDLIKHLLNYPDTLKASAINYEPHRLVNYLIETATHFHKFYTECRVVTENKELSNSRLALCEATKIIIASGCKILGIDAPEKM
jgi:arginyl-tRNA synthetase